MRDRKVKIDVNFLIEKVGEDMKNSVFAYFPNENYNVHLYGDTKKNCYAHIGQHSSCHVDYAKSCKDATYSEYVDLLKELHSIGYICNVLNPLDIECHREPTKSEIKFGEGATHYRTFNINEIGFNVKGELKSRFKAKDDMLFYSRK